MGGSVTLNGHKFALKGTVVKEGELAPDCRLVNKEMKDVKVSSFIGKPLLLISVPSLDTSVCSKETHRFNQEISKLQDFSVVCVSMDLPFAQTRWAETQGVNDVILLSDFRYREFGEKYGVLITDLGLLARALFLVDSQGKIQKVHLMEEISQEPNYELVIHQIKSLTTEARR